RITMAGPCGSSRMMNDPSFLEKTVILSTPTVTSTANSSSNVPTSMSEILQHLATPFQYEYMRQAIWVSVMIGGVCGFLSSFVTLKGWSLMGDALSHAVVPGVAVAYILGLPFAVGAFIAGLL